AGRGGGEPIEVRALQVLAFASALGNRDGLAIGGQPRRGGDIVGEDVEEHVTIEQATTELLEPIQRGDVVFVDAPAGVEQDHFGVGPGGVGQGGLFAGGAGGAGEVPPGPRGG